MLGRSSVPASHCEHVTNLIDWLVNVDVIGVVDIHGCVSVNMSVSSLINAVHGYVITSGSVSGLVNAICGYMIASVTGSKGADCKNTNSFFSLFAEILFQKRNSLNHRCHMSVKLSWGVALSANSLGHGWITLVESLNTW